MTAMDQDPNRYRYSENDSRPFFLNTEHYLQAHQIIDDYARSLGVRTGRPPSGRVDTSAPRQVRPIRIDEENRLLPVDGYFALYSDLLGFTMEVSQGGMDSLPDYYGGTFVGATQHPEVQAYLLSDSCFAFAPVNAADAFIRFVETIFGLWMSNGLVPQCAVGCGSFVERRPFSDKQPSNFFGTQITGTALIDAVGILKRNKPFGARILMSDSAQQQWPSDQLVRIVSDGNCSEFLPTRPISHCLFEGIYYLLCTRDHEPGSDAFKHYVWSAASRIMAGGTAVGNLVGRLVTPYYTSPRYEVACDQIAQAVSTYTSEPMPTPEPTTGPTRTR